MLILSPFELDEKKPETFTAETQAFARAKPIYTTLPRWSENLTGIRSTRDLPANCMAYLNFIEEQTGAMVNLISTGAGRESVIEIQRAF